jgi:hypothetical protein
VIADSQSRRGRIGMRGQHRAERSQPLDTHASVPTAPSRA